MKYLMLLVLLVIGSITTAQELQAFKIYDQNGEQTGWESMLEELSQQEVVLFGEFHDNPVIHWLELKVLEQLYDRNPNLVLGAEMFEADNQLILDEYLEGRISQSSFESEMRLWQNYQTDYKPLVEFAKEHSLRFVATNVPRRYASMVARQGMDKLVEVSEDAQNYLPELPVEVDTLTPGYSEMLTMMEGHGPEGSAMNYVAAQALKDASMSQRILHNLLPDGLLLHFNGNYHSKDYGGIYWYLKKARPDLKISTISVEQSQAQDLGLPDDSSQGDFIIVVPADFPKSY